MILDSDITEFLSLAVSPERHLYLYSDVENQEMVSKQVADKIYDLFSEDKSTGLAIGLLRLGITHFTMQLPPSLAFWQEFVRLFINELCKLSGLETVSNDELSKLSASPFLSEFDNLLKILPFMRGSEYINADMMSKLWHDLGEALTEELTHFNGQLQDYFVFFNPTWNRVGRVWFHLAENKTNADYPFAFLATYTTKISGSSSSSSSSHLQHLPLNEALKEYSGTQKSSQLLSLLLPIQKATEKSPFIKNLVDSGTIFEAQCWKTKDAYQFLKDIPVIEEAGVVVRVPNWWNPKKPPRPQITVSVGNASASVVGMDALLDFNMHFALPEDDNITLQELEDLIKTQGQLVQIKGQWVEIDSDKLQQVLSYWKKVEHRVKTEGLSFAEALRLLSGTMLQETEETTDTIVAEWSKVIEGPWLNDILSRLRCPDQNGDNTLLAILQQYLSTNLRPYQQTGVGWLWWLYNLNLGGCLADDMGLGKTIQILALLLLVKHHNNSQGKKPHLLILPASLLGNWQGEINKFAPTLKYLVAHNSVITKDKNIGENEMNTGNTDLAQAQKLPDLSNVDLVITTYAYVNRLAWLKQISWNIVIADEAQNIKNPVAKQTQAIKQLISKVRFVLTGTPIENRLLDMWSLFDFVAPNLLGTSKVFSNYGKKSAKGSNDSNINAATKTGSIQQFYTTVRNLVSPYILRRLKNDKQIIDDLPDKTEIEAYCHLTKQQVALYQQSINDLKNKLDQGPEGIERSGLVLSYLTRFKQICNHPSQWRGHGYYDPQESGKFIRLQELCEVIAAKQEKVLIFTQFREIMPALGEFVAGIFTRPGIMLYGQTAIKERAKLVESFQQEQGPPFFILSLKAGGTGLNLTNASHVIHFDRWWNPAVENQATDRAYRIGQKKNVLVHKFICHGTIEEKIDFLIKSKKSLSDEFLTNNSEAGAITNFSDEELLKILTLDIHRAVGET